MPRLNVVDLAEPKRRYRIDRLPAPLGRKHGFETEAQASKEDGRRTYLAASFHASLAGPSTPALNRLIKRLSQSAAGVVPWTLASSLFMRGLRVRFIGAVWRFAVRYRHLGVTVATIIPRGWEVPVGDLHKVDTTKLLAAFRSELYRAGAKHASGGLIACLHGEHEPSRGVYQLHLHAVIAGDMIGVVDRLRKRRNYRKLKPAPGQPHDTVRTRIQIKRMALTNLAYTLSYIWKSFWLSRLAEVGEDGVPRRNRGGRRIPGPAQVEVLQFLDRHRPSDFCLLVHVNISYGGFYLSHT